MSSISRNQACPCGSSKRYKHCCGDPASITSPSQAAQPDYRHMMNAALRQQTEDELIEAEVLYRKVLDIRPDEPDTLHMLGVICHQTHRQSEALDLIWRAAELTDWQIPSMRENLRLTLVAACAGTSGQAAKLRIAYAKWQDDMRQLGSMHEPLVSIVVAPGRSADDLAASLESVYRQTYRRLEVVLVLEPGYPLSGELLTACPFPHSTVFVTETSLAARLNQAIRKSAGDFVNILMPGDRFDQQRIEKMVSAVVNRAGEWGFSMAGFSPSADEAVISFEENRAREAVAAREHIEGEDAVGFALLGEINVPASLSNLFFGRRIFDVVGRFAECATTIESDFGLSAVFEAEPVFVEQVLCHCGSASGISSLNNNKVDLAKSHADSKQMPGRFYDKVLSAALPRNPFAPAMAIWSGRLICKISGNSSQFSMLSPHHIRTLVEMGKALQSISASHRIAWRNFLGYR